MREPAGTMQQQLWGGAVAAILLAVMSGLGEGLRRRRRDMDNVGWVPWQFVQVMAMLAAVILASVALNIRQ